MQVERRLLYRTHRDHCKPQRIIEVGLLLRNSECDSLDHDASREPLHLVATAFSRTEDLYVASVVGTNQNETTDLIMRGVQA